MVVPLMDIQHNPNNYMQKINRIIQLFSRDIGDFLQRTLGMSDHIKLKQHDNNVACQDVQLHAANK